ncbi:MAG: AraC family transcriptional regulator [Tannerella sp.]|jgi:AraC-like DNA-binding protein|nr:AraC family transcriptional regulator [Tannerella sp.]
MNATQTKTHNFSIRAKTEQWGIEVKAVGMQYIPERATHTIQPLTATEYRFLYIRKVSTPEKSTDPPIGFVYFLFPEDLHPIREKTQDDYQEYWISFEGLLADRILPEFNLHDKTAIIHPEIDLNLEELFQKAICFRKKQSIHTNQVLTGILMQMLGVMNYQQNLNDAGFIQEVLHNKIMKAKQMMHKYITENISGKEIADKMGMGYDNFRRLFKKIVGISPAQYMQNIRMDKAKNLLLQSTASVKEISYLLNFENPCYFSKTFKKKEGRSPAEYRYLMRNAM